VAQKIVADQQANGGLLTATDLASYQPLHADPIAVAYRGYTILLPPPASGGGALIAFALKLMAGLSLASIKHNSFDHLRLLAEVMRLANLARAEWEAAIEQSGSISNSATQKRVETLLSEPNIQKYAGKLQAILSAQTMVPDLPAPKGPSNTSHVSVADANGMLVSVTTSAGENAGYMVADTGVMLNNMLGEIDLHPGGFHRLPPGQRMLTMMSPTLVLRQNKPVLAVGSGGSNRLRSAILQLISNWLDFDMPLAEAVDAPRVHFEDNQLQLEGGILPEVAHQLEAAGYAINRWPERNMFFGGTHAVARQQARDTQSATWTAAGDRRRGGAVVTIG